jgi:ubiquinone biosynthesis protein
MKPLRMLKNAVRAKEILSVLARYGFTDILQYLGTHSGPFRRLVPSVGEKLSTWERIRLACEDLGPTFVKIGQILSTRPDLIPAPLIAEFKKLQEKARPEDWESIHKVLEEEWHENPESICSEINPIPLAAASLAQVHEARMQGSTEVVVIKIQRPNIQQKVESDLEIFYWIADQLHQRFDALKLYDLPTISQVVGDGIRRELDFTNEARHLEHFHRVNAYPKTVGAPILFSRYTTSRVLVMEKIEGKRPDELFDLPYEERARIAHQGALSLFHQIVIDGFFHADPHPGNLRIQSDGKVIFLDWGLVGYLTPSMRYAMASLVEATLQGDAEMVAHLALQLSQHPHRVNLHELERAIVQDVDHFFELNNKECDFGQVILELMNIFGKHHVGLSSDFSLVAKSVLSIEETGKLLDPDFNVSQVVTPLIRKLRMERMSPAKGWRWMRLWLAGNLFRLQRFPLEIQRLLGRINDGELTVNLKVRNFQDLRSTLDGASNRLALAVILGSIVIGSSMIITTGVEPLLFGYPAIGLVGYVVSGLLGAWTIIDIIRHGKHK